MSAAHFGPGSTSSITITASSAAGVVSLSANGDSRSFMVTDHTGIANWIVKKAAEGVRRLPVDQSRPDTLDIVTKKLEAAKRR